LANTACKTQKISNIPTDFHVTVQGATGN